jgi:hypothetical protein
LRFGREIPKKKNSAYPSFMGGPAQQSSEVPSTTSTQQLEFLMLLFSIAIVQTIVLNTNAYAQLTGKAKWVDTDVAEVYRFIATMLYMGIVRIGTNRRGYWSSDEIFQQFQLFSLFYYFPYYGLPYTGLS